MSDSIPRCDPATPRVVVFALNGLEMDRRVENEARMLSSHGFDVVRVGMREFADQPPVERTAFDTIVRMSPRGHRVKPPRALTAESSSGATQALARQWGPKLLVMGALRRLLPGTMKSFDRIRKWRRWSDTYVEAGAELKPDAIIACDLDTIQAGVTLKRHLGCVLVYDAHELWTEQHCHSYLTRPFKWAMNAVEGRCSRQADLVTTVSNRFADRMSERYNIERPWVVYGGAEECLGGGEATEMGSPVRAYFQGSFTPDRGLHEIIRAMALVDGVVTLTLQGFGRLREELVELARSLGLLDNGVEFVEACAPADVARAASAYDIGIVAAAPESLNARLTTPNRAFAYIAGGLAVVTSAELKEIADIVTERGCGVVVDGEGPEPLAAALRKLAADSEALFAMKTAAQEACADFAWDKQFGPVVRFIDDALKV
jgi:glycosyltransferase involved in cell wall biosynthesis